VSRSYNPGEGQFPAEAHNLGFPSATLGPGTTTLASAQAVLDVAAMRPHLGTFARAIRASSDFDRAMWQVERLVGKP
jgi:hypothetical protein